MVSTIGGPPPPFADSGPGGYSGDLVFRELVQHEDGTLGTKWPEEMIPATGAPLRLAFMALCGDVSYKQDAIRLRGRASFSAGMFIHAPQDTLIRLDIKPAAGTSSFGLCFARVKVPTSVVANFALIPVCSVSSTAHRKTAA